MQIHIRTEQASNYVAVETIARDAFWNLYMPGCTDHFIIHHLRTHPDCIGQLCFVIEVNGTVVGSIFYSHSKVVDANYCNACNAMMWVTGASDSPVVETHGPCGSTTVHASQRGV